MTSVHTYFFLPCLGFSFLFFSFLSFFIFFLFFVFFVVFFFFFFFFYFFFFFLVSQSGTLKVADFGTSRLVGFLSAPHERAPPHSDGPIFETSEFALTKAIGTLAWMAPEVLDGQKYGQKADVYSYAVVCWEIGSQQLPWMEKKRSWDVSNAVLGGQRPSLDALQPECPLRGIILQGWQQDPHNRPTFDGILVTLGALAHQ